jgi:prophage DNA circulation protein
MYYKEAEAMNKFYIPLGFAAVCFGLIIFLRLHGAIWDDLRDAFDKIKNFEQTVRDLSGQIEEKTHIVSTLQGQVNNFTQQINNLGQQVTGLTDKVNKTAQGITRVVTDIVFLGNAIKSSVVTIKNQQKPEFDKAAAPSQKMLIVAQMIDTLVPVIRSVDRSIVSVGDGLVKIFDQNAYQQIMQVSQEVNQLIGLVGEINGLLRELSTTVSLIAPVK